MTLNEKEIFKRIETAIGQVAAKYRQRGDHDGDLIADAMDDLENAIAAMRMDIPGF